MWVPKQEKAWKLFCIAKFSEYGCQKKSVEYEMECRQVAVQKGKQDQIHS